MKPELNVLHRIYPGELPEPRGYAWFLNGGDVQFTDDQYCPVEPEEWSYAVALYDADQCREYARAAIAELREAAEADRAARMEMDSEHRPYNARTSKTDARLVAALANLAKGR